MSVRLRVVNESQRRGERTQVQVLANNAHETIFVPQWRADRQTHPLYAVFVCNSQNQLPHLLNNRRL